MGGIIGVHHFTTIGTLAYIGGMSRIINDVPPFMIVEGNPARVRGFNETGMKRWGFSEDQIRGIREAYRVLFGPKAATLGASILDRVSTLEDRAEHNGEVRYLCECIRRSVRDGVYGRWLERERQDTHADRQAFYAQDKQAEGTK